MNTEVYTDDWNDDRYDRCKRWEKKHGMTVSEYWELHGIDSKLEKNVLENMQLMGNDRREESLPVEEDLLLRGEVEILDDVDDFIVEDEDEVFEDDNLRFDDLEDRR